MVCSMYCRSKTKIRRYKMQLTQEERERKAIFISYATRHYDTPEIRKEASDMFDEKLLQHKVEQAYKDKFQGKKHGFIRRYILKKLIKRQLTK